MTAVRRLPNGRFAAKNQPIPKPVIRAQPKPVPDKRPATEKDFNFYTQGYPLCCGAAILTGFNVSADVRAGRVDMENIPAAALNKWKAMAGGAPNVTGITVHAPGSGHTVQKEAEVFLKHMGFEPIRVFKGAYGGQLCMWLYINPRSVVEEA